MAASGRQTPPAQASEATEHAAVTGGAARLRFNLERWCLWWPGPVKQDRCWPGGRILAADDGGLDFLPMMQRRRLSPLARAAIAVAWHCREGYLNLPAVFFSRHGESGHYFDMLCELAGSGEISPSRFSLSVHNAIAGLYSLCSETRAPCVALAGGRDDFYGAFLEAAGMLMENACERLLLVCYEQPLPEVYQPYAGGPDRTLALAMRLSAASGPGPKIELTRTAIPPEPDSGCQLQAFCEAIVRGERQPAVSGHGTPWTWALTDG